MILNKNSLKIEQPKGLKVKLMPHQLANIYEMIELEKKGYFVVKNRNIYQFYDTLRKDYYDYDEIRLKTRYAILADKVGAGKSYCIIGLILKSPLAPLRKINDFELKNFKIRCIKDKIPVIVNLIIVKHILVNQWISYLNNSKLDFLILNRKSDLDIFKDKEKKEDLLYSKDVFLLNISRYSIFKQYFQSITWNRLIIDEIDTVMIPSTFNETGYFNWLITATPSRIIDKQGVFHRKLFENKYWIINYITIKSDDDFVDSSLNIPKSKIFIIRTLLTKMVSSIMDLVPEEVLKLINSGNMKEAITTLNCNVDTKDNIFQIMTNKYRKEIHNLKAEIKYLKTIISTDTSNIQEKIEKNKNEILRLKERINVVQERLESVTKDNCFICLDDFKNPVILNCCNNVCCLKCLLSSLRERNTCPYCRHEMDHKGYHIIGKTKGKKKSNKFIKMDKIQVLEKILKFISRNFEKPRIIIFSDYSETFDKILVIVKKSELNYTKLNGNPNKINMILEKYEKGEINVLMVNSREYGNGMNLHMTDIIIIYHKVSEETKKQIIGRAERFGRENPLKIIYIVNDSEENSFNETDTFLKSSKDFSALLDF